MNAELAQKYERLTTLLKRYESLMVAFSGGVDSTFLLCAAQDTLGAHAIAVTAHSRSFPARELEASIRYCKEKGIRHFVIDTDELAIEGFSQNLPDRCYRCKSELFKKIRTLATQKGISVIAEGSNSDDESDDRPGLQAVLELGIKSPLREARLTKTEIRALSRERGLETWDKPSFACLATRFAVGESISAEKLKRVDEAEQFLIDLGFTQVRVRVHGEPGDHARIEITPEEFCHIIEEQTRRTIHRRLSDIGFRYISLDLSGYKMGNMNAVP